MLALEKEAAVGEEVTLGGAAVIRWNEHVARFAERYGLKYVDTRLPGPSHLDLSKIKGLRYEPRHDVRTVVDSAEVIRRSNEDAGSVHGGEV